MNTSENKILELVKEDENKGHNPYSHDPYRGKPLTLDFKSMKFVVGKKEIASVV